MKYIAYVRKSTDDKKNQIQSIPNQLDWVKKTALHLGISVIQTFSDKKTATKPGRDGFDEMMRFINNSNEPLGILCWKISRLARNSIDEGTFKYAFRHGKVPHVFASDREFKEGDNIILMGLEFGIATQSSIDLSHSVTFGMNRKIEYGYRPTGVPMGYLNDPYGKKGERKIYKDHERFDLLQGAWNKLLTEAYSVEKIRKELNSEGFKNLKGQPLPKASLYRIFSNSFYAGYYSWSENIYEGKHPKMITPAQYEKAQQILGRKNTTRAYKSDPVFNGLILCGECCYSITSEHHTKTIKKTGKKKRYTYLRCTKKNPLIKCEQKYLSVIKAEKQIQSVLSGLNLPQHYIDFCCEWHLQNQKQGKQILGRRKGVLQKKYNDNLVMKQNLIDHLNKNVIDTTQFQETMARYREEEIQLKDQLQNLEANNDDWLEKLKNDFRFAKNAQEQYKNGTKNRKREILMHVGSNWKLKDGKLLTELLPPFMLFNQLRIFCESKITWLEPTFSLSMTSKNTHLLVDFSEWSPLWDEVRTFYCGN